MHREEAIYPFSAVVGQEQVRRALLLNAVSHEVGGVLVRGQRGTAKSTLARGLAHLLPEIEVAKDCPFSCDPCDIESLCGYCAKKLAEDGSLPTARTRMKLVTLPLNATEEMVVGTLDIERALRRGERCFEPGILARANRSVLYVDEVNLLEDHIVDTLLDSAAMGVNVVERESISFRHGARFILIGTMNPEEGDLRPQLEDRFGLCAEVDAVTTPEQRVEILKRNMQFKRNPLEFESRWHSSQEAVRKRILTARELYPGVEIPEDILEAVARITDGANADGHRADIAMLSAARALAALEDSPKVTEEHIACVAMLALNHRFRKGPLSTAKSRRPGLEALLGGGGRPEPPHREETEAPPARETETRSPVPARGSKQDRLKDADVPHQSVSLDEIEPSGDACGRRSHQVPADGRGRYYRSAAPDKGRLGSLSASEVAIDATVRASARRMDDTDGKPRVQPEDIRVKLKKRRCGFSIVFVVDASASMGVQKRLEAARLAILSLLVEAYQRRDRVGLVVFKDESAQLVMSPTSSSALADRLMSRLEPGGTTPLSHGLALGYRVLSRELSREPTPTPMLVLISDGGGNVTMGGSDPMSEALEIAREINDKGICSVVFDSAPVSSDAARTAGRQTAAHRICEAMSGSYFAMRNPTCEAILDRVASSAGLPCSDLPSQSLIEA